MPIDPAHLQAYAIPEARQPLTRRDTAFYALSVGLGMDPLDERQLQFADADRDFRALPSMVVVLAHPGFWLANPDTGVDATQVVHGEQEIVWHAPLPVEGEIRGKTQVTGLVDKGSNALLYSEKRLTKESRPMSNVKAIDYNAMSDEAFRRMVRDWIAANYPEEIRNPLRRLGIEATRRWYERLSRQGWLTPGWPQEYGGMGLAAGKQLIMMEEMEQYGCARMPDSGITMLGPLLIRYGTEEQKARFLPAIQSGEHIWCQGYSEPNAGSDLAGLRTEAVLDGDHWVVNGQKIWTTMATEANWIFVLVRTDREAKPQAGISFLLVDMNTPGVEVRPIDNLERHAEFCEVFFTNVRVPKENLVGEINKGWSMAKALLGFERIFLGSPKQSTNALVRVERLARHLGIREDPVFQDRYVTLAMDLDCQKVLYERFADQLKQGKQLGPDVSMLKVFQSELYQRISELAILVAGERSGTLDPFQEDSDLHPAGLFIQSRPTTIYGGSNEVQRNILAQHVLGLPR